MRRYTELTRIAATGLRARAGRTTLTCISLLIGVLAIITVEAASAVAGHVLLRPAEITSGKEHTYDTTLENPTLTTLTAAQNLLTHTPDDVDSALLYSGSGAQVTTRGTRIPVIAYQGDLRA
ncbi:MAG: hypothetical protein ACRDTD_31310, partial [Pseudonocardiaceae bacterium]